MQKNIEHLFVKSDRVPESVTHKIQICIFGNDRDAESVIKKFQKYLFGEKPTKNCIQPVWCSTDCMQSSYFILHGIQLNLQLYHNHHCITI